MKKGYVRSIRFFSCFEVLSQNVTHRIFVCIKFKNGDRLILPGVSNFSAESLRRRFVMWWHMHETQILVHFRDIYFLSFSLRNPHHVTNSNFSAFSNNCDLTCPKLIFHDSIINISSRKHFDSSINHFSWLIVVSFYRKWENIKCLENALKFEFGAYAITWQISFEDFLH